MVDFQGSRPIPLWREMAESSAVVRGRPVEPAPGNAGEGNQTFLEFPGATWKENMIAPRETFEPKSSDAFPASRKVYVPGQIHSDVRVPFREIELSRTKLFQWRLRTE